MDNLEQNYNRYLPINRKERFYTATILPNIICSDDFKYFNRFLELIDNFPNNLLIKPNPSDNNIQIITEFSLKESANYIGKEYQNVPETKETPDLVILITEPELLLIVLEGKMFDKVKLDSFKSQINGQKKIIDCIKENLSIKESNIYHLGLVPKGYCSKDITVDCQIIYWEDIISAFADVCQNNHFLGVLKIAVSNYDNLVSKNESAFGQMGKNMEDRMTGEQIIELHNSGKRFWVGRNRGLNGEELWQDRESGGWRTYSYEVNFSDNHAPNRNWFSSGQFVHFIGDKVNKIDEIDNDLDREFDRWHFSYLGKDYFNNIQKILEMYRLPFNEIETIYTGKSNVPYFEKTKGRKVNPNWCVRLKNGKEYKFGTPTGNKLVEGLWDLSKCNRFAWEEIKNFKWFKLC